MSRRRKPNTGNPARTNCTVCTVCKVCRPLVGAIAFELDENGVPTGDVGPVCTSCALKAEEGVLR